MANNRWNKYIKLNPVQKKNPKKLSIVELVSCDGGLRPVLQHSGSDLPLMLAPPPLADHYNQCWAGVNF